MSSATPLRDRLPANSSDTNPEWSSPTTTPLRISKRDSPRGVQLARRQSSSYNHLRKNNLVSKSPFKSQIPTAAKPLSLTPTRRVSGEKRSRPSSMHDQAENEHPLGFKRRQSRAFQGLIEKEPVTKSPFRHTPSDEPRPSPPLTNVPQRKLRRKTPEYENVDELPPPPPSKTLFSPRNSPSPRPTASPARPSLVSRRLHGPREAGGVYGRRARRKTVTFDETCDVVEYDVDDEMDDNAFDWVTDDDDDEHRLDEPHQQQEPTPDDSYDSSHTGEDSITGLVDSMLQDAEPRTPPQANKSLPDDLETQDGVPYGRTHHSERAAQARQDFADESVNELPLPALQDSVSTPPHSRPGTPINSVSPGSHMPLGRSTHSERIKARKEEEVADIEEDVQMLPPSPSPAKRTATPTADADPFSYHSTPSKDEELDPANLSIGHSEVSLSGIDMEIDAKLAQNLDPAATSTPPTSPPSLGILAKLNKRASNNSFVVNLDSPPSTRLPTRAPLPPLPTQTGSPGLRRPLSGSPLSSRVHSPLPHALTKSNSSSNLGTPDGSVTGRSRPPREDVQKRILSMLNADSPHRDAHESVSSISNDIRGARRDSDQGSYNPMGSTSSRRGDKEAGETQRKVAPPLSRDNPTYDGVISLDPEPQSIDPPRPSVPARSHSTDCIEPEDRPVPPFAGLNLTLGNGSGIGEDLGLSMGEVPLGDMRSALDRLMEDVAEEALGPGGQNGSTTIETDIEETTGRFSARAKGKQRATSESDFEDETEDTMDCGPDVNVPPPVGRALTEPVLHAMFASPEIPAPSSRPVSPLPPTAPHGNAIKAREELIKAKKREARRREEDEDLGLYTPPRRTVNTRSRRRSRSTGDAEDMTTRDPAARRRANLSEGGLLNVGPIEGEEDPLADSIDRELRKLGNPARGKYHIREHSETIYASADVDTVSHLHGAGDVDSGKAWRPVRRPSDMNEYAKQIRELRAQEAPGKAHGKVFVKVLGVQLMPLPLPQQPTAVTCTLNNGIHFVTTPEVGFGDEFEINQEFELIEHSKLEWTLSFKVRRDPHIMAQFKANTAPPPAPRVQAPPPASKGGMRSFFRSSPKKAARASPQPPPPPVHRMQENLARYLLPDGTLARAFVCFKDIAKHCDTKLFETSCRLIGQKAEVGMPPQALQVGEVILQVFRLPPLPGIPQDALPQSLEECHRGLRHTSWHKVVYYEGILTQTGGDCSSWRRRHLRVVGASLVAFNDVTKKMTATIDLKKAIAVEDDEETRANLLSPGSGGGGVRRSRYVDEFEGPYGVERSFRLVFPNDQEIIFFADTDEEKAAWLDVLRALVGRIPPNPLWAELAWQRQQGLGKQAVIPQGSRSASPAPHR